MYDENAPALVANGYHSIPIEPNTKKPGRYSPSQHKFVGIPDWQISTMPVPSPQPGAGIGVRVGNGLVCVDFDHDEHALILSDVFGSSPVNKAGQTAWSGFYRTNKPVPNQNYYTKEGVLVLQILAERKQTVLPPTIHEGTGLPYQWCNGRSLYDTPLGELPLLPDDYHEKILALGYVTSALKLNPDEKFDPETGEIESGFDANPCADLNRTGLHNLPAWVPALLPDAKRRKGRYPAYDAVNPSRPSSTGRPYEQRKRNLGIVSTGIRDFGIDQSYSPLDLVMAVRGTDLAEAFCWLEEKLLGPKPGIEVDWEKIADTQDAPSAAPEDGNDTGDDNGGTDTKTENPDDVWVGKEWEDGDPIPAPLPMLIPYFVPLEPYLGYLWGQSQTYKTFLLNTMAVAVASRGLFAGQQVRERGLVYQVELEGSRSQLRIQAAKQFAGIKDKLPIVHVTKTPPSLIGAGKRVSNDWKKWAGAIVRKARAAAERWGVSLKLITIDPQNHFAGFTDEQSSAEGNVVCNALIAMAKEAGCPVLVADHLGKDPAAGGRGTSVKHQSPWFILDAGESAEELGEDRILIIRKMKDGEDGLGISFHMEKYPTKIEQLVRGEDGSFRAETAAHDTLVVVFEGEVRPVNTINSTPSNPLTDKEQIVLNQVIRMTNTEGQELPEEANAPAGLRGVLISRLQVRITRNTSFAGKGRGTALFQRTLDSLMAKKKIDSFDGLAWVPIAD
jgi:hypothetical protein